MATKKELQDEELNNVSGGAAVKIPIDLKDMCPNCRSTDVKIESVGKGCGRKLKYTCNRCGHTW